MMYQGNSSAEMDAMERHCDWCSEAVSTKSCIRAAPLTESLIHSFLLIP